MSRDKTIGRAKKGDVAIWEIPINSPKTVEQKRFKKIKSETNSPCPICTYRRELLSTFKSKSSIYGSASGSFLGWDGEINGSSESTSGNVCRICGFRIIQNKDGDLEKGEEYIWRVKWHCNYCKKLSSFSSKSSALDLIEKLKKHKCDDCDDETNKPCFNCGTYVPSYYNEEMINYRGGMGRGILCKNCHSHEAELNSYVGYYFDFPKISYSNKKNIKKLPTLAEVKARIDKNKKGFFDFLKGVVA